MGSIRVVQNKYDILDDFNWDSFVGKTRGQLNKALNESAQTPNWRGYAVVHIQLAQKMHSSLQAPSYIITLGVGFLVITALVAGIFLGIGNGILFFTVSGSIACGVGAISIIPIAIGSYKAKQYYTFSRHQLTREEVASEKKALADQIQREIEAIEQSTQSSVSKLKKVKAILTEEVEEKGTSD